MLPAETSSYWSAQQQLSASTLAVVKRLWRKMGNNFDESWLQIEEPLLLLILQAQLSAAERAAVYVPETLGALNIDVDPDFEIDPSSVVGVAGSGLPVDSLLVGAKVAAKRAVGEGATSSLALQVGGVWLETAVKTLLSDTGRAAESLAISVRPGVGYVRMMNPPSCGRCAVLAGRFYRYNTGFDRHLKCDCRHIPARESIAGDLRVDPKKYFDSLDQAQQNKHFTVAGAEAIREGADITQVVNARRGMSTAQVNLAGWIPQGRLGTKKVYGQDLAITDEGKTRRGIGYEAMLKAGYAQRQTDVRLKGSKYFQSRAPRLMPESIFKIAEDRPDALRLLRLYGYLSDGVPVKRIPSAKVAGRVASPKRPATSIGGGIKPPSGSAPSRTGFEDEGDRPRASDGTPVPYARGQQISVLAKRRRHILDGDKRPTSGGHRFGTGRDTKTEFPESWTDDQIIASVQKVVDSRGVSIEHIDGRFLLEAVVDRVLIRVVMTEKAGNPYVITAHPLDGDGVFKNVRGKPRPRPLGYYYRDRDKSQGG